MSHFINFIFLFSFIEFGAGAAPKEMNLLPGKSISDVYIGQSRSSLKGLGFLADDSRDQSLYLKKNDILVRLDDEKVVQIWYTGKDLSLLKIRGLNLPKNNRPETLRRFFEDCGADHEGTGGVSIYCEGHGIELTYSHLSKEFVGISVGSFAVVESDNGSGKSKKTL